MDTNSSKDLKVFYIFGVVIILVAIVGFFVLYISNDVDLVKDKAVENKDSSVVFGDGGSTAEKNNIGEDNQIPLEQASLDGVGVTQNFNESITEKQKEAISEYLTEKDLLCDDKATTFSAIPSVEIWIEDGILHRSRVQNDNCELIMWRIRDVNGKNLFEGSARTALTIDVPSISSGEWASINIVIYAFGAYQNISNVLINKDLSLEQQKKLESYILDFRHDLCEDKVVDLSFPPSVEIWIEDGILHRSRVQNDNCRLLSWKFTDENGEAAANINARGDLVLGKFPSRWEMLSLEIYMGWEYKTISNTLVRREVLPEVISVTYPKKGDTLKIGAPTDITWESENFKANYVNIVIEERNETNAYNQGNIKKYTENDGIFTWDTKTMNVFTTINETRELDEGRYFITVYKPESSNGVGDSIFSDKIMINLVK